MFKVATMLQRFSHLPVMASIIVAIGSLGARSVQAEMIYISDPTFSTAAAQGSVGGFIATGATTRTIGTGPWTGTFQGIKIGFVSVLAPSLTIGSGVATISGVSSVAGLENDGYFSQVLTTNYKPLTTYTLTTSVTTDSLLGVGLLNSTGVGIGLTDGAGNLLASTATNPTLATLALVSGTTYQLQLTYTTGVTATGSIGVRLFDSPSGVANLNLLSSVSFDNVSLTSNAISNAQSIPEPASVVLVALGLMIPILATRRRSCRSLQA